MKTERKIQGGKASRDKKYHPGHWFGIGLGVGLVTGLFADVLLATIVNINFLWFGAGSTIGIASGAVAGTLLEKKYKHRRRVLTPAEKEKHKRTVILTAMSITMLIVVSVFLLIKKVQT